MRKGQIMSTDYIIGVTLFIIVLATSTYIWNNTLYRSQKDYIEMEMMNMAKRTSDQLVRSPGIPETWESNISSLQAVGLKVKDGVISETKLDELEAMDYDDLRGYLGVGSYNVYVKVSTSSGAIFGEAGTTPTGEIVVNFQRLAIMNEEQVLIDVSISSEGVVNLIPPIL